MTKAWEFRTKNFRVVLKVEEDYGYQYDGDDEDGETQRKLDNGEYVAFDSVVSVYFRGARVGFDGLGGSVYETLKVDEFWTAHRDPRTLNRNCTLMRAAMGQNRVICHYFPDMVREAIAEARKTLASLPRLRNVA